MSGKRNDEERIYLLITGPSVFAVRSVHATLFSDCSVLIIDAGAVMGCVVCVCPTLSGGGHRGGEGG